MDDDLSFLSVEKKILIEVSRKFPEIKGYALIPPSSFRRRVRYLKKSGG